MSTLVEAKRPSWRIAMVAACGFPSPRGSQVLIRELAQALAARGHRVHLVTYPQGESLAAVQGLFIHRVRAPRFAATTAALGWRKVVLDSFLVAALYRVLRDHDIDIIHAHNYEGPLVGFPVRRLLGVPLVYHSHNALGDELGYYFRAGWRRRLARFAGRLLDRQVPRRADFSIALTDELRGFLVGCGVQSNRIAVIPPAASGSLPAERLWGEDPFPGRFVVMYSGNLDPYQDLEVMYRGFEAFAGRHPGAILVIVTHDGEWQRRTGALLSRLLAGQRARVLVVPTFSAVRRLLARADVLVCPRGSWSGFPIKLINYLAAGRPVIAAAASAKVIVNDETGLVFADGDAAGVELALERLFADADLRARLAANARKGAAALSTWDEAAARVEAVYATLAPSTGSLAVDVRANEGTSGLIASCGDRISAATRKHTG
jgi:glycosyltransferase involved in cell wall biosynthesis